MLDFLMVTTRVNKKGTVEVYPKFTLKGRSEDLMIRGGDFYAIWDENKNFWSTDEQDAIRLIDHEIDTFVKDNKEALSDHVHVLHMWDAETGIIDSWHKFCQKQCRDNFHMLDEELVFHNSEITKKTYASKCLPYDLTDSPCEAYDKLISALYSEDERHKIEWAIGSIVAGDSRKIQKFLVLYGPAGTGKSTILNIIQQLFEGYYSVFDAKALGSSSNSFALEAFKTNPLIAIQHDGDLSHIEDNTRLNSLVSHEMMTVNEKFKSTYANSFKCFLFMGTNKPVKITDAKSGIIRRLIDVSPTGNKIPSAEYKNLYSQISFELGSIANHCLKVYLDDPDYYDNYIPTSMMGASNDFYNFVEESYNVFKDADETSLKVAWDMYREYCEEAKVPYPMSQRAFKEELKNYFKDYKDRYMTDDGSRIRSYYWGFKSEIFDAEPQQFKQMPKTSKESWLKFDRVSSLLDIELANCLAQYATDSGTPMCKWSDVNKNLKLINTNRLHYVKVPENHIVIDFDIPDENGEKSLEKNMEAASKWPVTYAELSKSGKGIHLHYIYKGDPTKLSCVYDDHIEIKVFTGGASLRRKLSKCNGEPIREISSGLPLKGEKTMIDFDSVLNERAIRTIIKRSMAKEYNAGTKPSIDFIAKILNDQYEKGAKFDVSDMRPAVIAFAVNSTHHSDYCIKKVLEMRFKSEEPSDNVENEDQPITFFDVEVFPNLFILCWKVQGEKNKVHSMINPKGIDIEPLLKHRLVGFNNRKYDNHILYARYIGYDNEQLFKLSQRIISSEKQGKSDCFFGEAYNLSYTDIYDYSSKKQSLKKWEIDLRIHHHELGLDWNQPVPEERWNEVAGYCCDDVIATEAVWDATQGDFLARKILADLAIGCVNDTTNTLTTKLIFGKEKHPELVYTDLKTGKRTDGGQDIPFPDYNYVRDPLTGAYKNMCFDEDVGRGGYVWAFPGMYWNVWTFDVSSMHPHSIKALNAFGKFTQNFVDLMDARVFIKHKEFDKCASLFGGKLMKFLSDESAAKQLAGALKIAINSVYGLTSAAFDNPFKDARNVNNIVALRGALFMITLKKTLMEMGVTVIHCKTDSIKVVNPTPEIVNFINDFGNKYGYPFEVEHKFEKICLVNDAVYVAKLADDDEDWLDSYRKATAAGKEEPTRWTATGTQFQVPYVFKTLFSKENVEFDDVCETKSVSDASIYLDMNEKLGEDDHLYSFVGKIGLFCPIKPGCGGGLLLRKGNGSDKYNAVTGTKGYRWQEAEFVKDAHKEKDIDLSYYIAKVDEAKDTISKYGDVEAFVA